MYAFESYQRTMSLAKYSLWTCCASRVHPSPDRRIFTVLISVKISHTYNPGSTSRKASYRLSLPIPLKASTIDRHRLSLWYCSRCRVVNHRKHVDQIDPEKSVRSVAVQTEDELHRWNEHCNRNSNTFINCSFGSHPKPKSFQNVQKCFTDAYEYLMVGSSLVNRRQKMEHTKSQKRVSFHKSGISLSSDYKIQHCRY